MSDADIAPVVARIKNRIETVAGVGPVFAHDIYARDDIADLIVTTIDGQPTTRAWWITGPSLTAELAEQMPAGYQHRWWTYTIKGLTGLSANGDSIVVVRSLALAIADALDADRTLNGTCHTTKPCSWPREPDNRFIPGVAAVSYVELEKRVLTLSTPT